MNPLLILRARAEARAMLWRASEFELEEAMAPLREYAVASGIVDQLGAELTLKIIEAPFDGNATGTFPTESDFLAPDFGESLIS